MLGLQIHATKPGSKIGFLNPIVGSQIEASSLGFATTPDLPSLRELLSLRDHEPEEPGHGQTPLTGEEVTDPAAPGRAVPVL